MEQKRKQESYDSFKLARPLDLPDFYARLHQCIGGDGPGGIAWGGTPPAVDDPLFRENYLWAEIASKYDPGGNSSHLDDAAIVQFRESEQTCGQYNQLLLNADYRAAGFHRDYPDLSLAAVLHTAAIKIESLLKVVDWDEVARNVGFGPGATFSHGREEAHIWDKIGDQPDCNANAQCLVEAYLQHASPSWRRMITKRHGGIAYTCLNRVTTVPKDYRKNRTIAIEPVLSMFFQKGLGGVIRQRLKTVGVNLDDQGINQLAAFQGSLNGDLATIDLKAASDTVSLVLVRQLLPPDWLSALEQLRSSTGVLRLAGSLEFIEYQKFSSMGNGYTFELESLIFWALMRATLDLIGAKDRRVCVYGDDIVVPVAHADLLIAVLQRAGFTPNAKKTHTAGPFRESCGKHYLNGCDVTPFYIRRPVDDVEELFLLHNNLMRWAGSIFNLESNPGRDIRVKELCEWVRSHAPVACRRQSIPDGYGDHAFIGDFDECAPAPYGWAKHGCSLKQRAENKCTCPIGWQGWRAKHHVRDLKLTVPSDWRALMIASTFYMEETPASKQRRLTIQALPLECLKRFDLLRHFELGDAQGAIRDVRFGKRRIKSLLISGGWTELGIWR